MIEGWKSENLKDCCEVFTDGNWIESKDQSTEGIRLVQTGNIGFGFFKDKEDKARYISEETFKRLKCTEILQGDLLVSRLPDPVGKSCIIPDLDTKMITGVDCTIIRPKEYLTSKYLGYFQQSNDYLKNVLSKVSGTTRSRISRKNLGLIKIPIPPPSEQKQIVEILDEAFAAIDQARANIEKNIANAKELLQSKLNDIFSQKGDGWEEKVLGKICKRVSVGHVGKTSEYYCDNNGIPFIRSQNVRKGYVDLSNIRFVTKEFHHKLKKSQLKKGDILFVRVGANRGDCSALTEDYGELNCANIVFARPKSENSKFIEYYFQSPVGRESLLGLTTGSAQGVINTRSIEKTVISFPSEIEQETIVEKIQFLQNNIDELLEKYGRKLNELEELKKSILQKAFAGELTNKMVEV